MEDLNKNQIILLALLVSFISSVATSIMTYSLLVEAPPTVTQTVNRVVERTVETVVPSQVRPDVITREVTVVVKEEDLVIEAIEKNENSLVRLWGVIAGEKTFLGLGVLLNKDGLIAAAKVVQGRFSLFETALLGAEPVPAALSFSSENLSFFNMSIAGESPLKPAVLGDSDNLQLGQTVIAVKGEEGRNTISVGRITSLVDWSPGQQETFSKFSMVETDLIGVSKGVLFINLKGEIIGLGVDSLEEFIPSNVLKEKSTN